MEAAIVDALAEEGVEARGRDHEGPQYTGVWVEDRKIASIGVHLSRGVSAHGFAVNVDNDVEPFDRVVACGLPGVRMTSVALETGARGHAARASASAWPYAYAQRARRRASGSSRRGAARTRRAPRRYPRSREPAPPRLHVTRSRANPGGMDVTKVLGHGHAAVPRPQAGVVQGPAAGRPKLPRAERR